MTDATTKERLDALVEELRQQRDDLRVRLHLAKADARDEWEKLEKRWEHLRGKLGVAGKEAGAASRDVLDAARLVVDEIKAGYERVRRLL